MEFLHVRKAKNASEPEESPAENACYAGYLRNNLADGMIFAYNCCLRLDRVMSATRIVSSEAWDEQHLRDSLTQQETKNFVEFKNLRQS